MTMSPLRRLRVGLVALSIVFLVAVAGYWLAGWRLLDSVYMVVITLSTVGYREVHDLSPALQVFTMVVIVFGVFTALYTMGGFVQMTLEGEVNRALGLRRLSQEIERLCDHVVLCGFGRMGEILALEMHRHKRPFVIIENDSERVAVATGLHYLALQDDATEEDALLRAGVVRAKSVVTTLPSDADNVFITLTARNLNSQLFIIARGELPSTEKKLVQAGADRVVLPAATGALRMATMIIRPYAVELLEVVAGRQMAEVEVDEVVISASSPLVGKSIRQVQPRSRHGLLIVAVRRGGGSLQFNPGGETVFEAEASVLVMGRQADIDAFRTEYGL